MLARFIQDDTPLLLHPLGSLEVKQLKVPMETTIDRIGSSPVTSRRINLADPKVGGLDASAVSHAVDLFAPGHFITMNQDEQASRPDFESFPCGIQVATSAVPLSGPAVELTYAWNTVYPHEDFEPHRALWALESVAGLAMRSNAVAKAARVNGNPYLGGVDPVKLGEAGRVTIRRKDDLAPVAGAAGASAMTTTEAARSLEELAAQRGDALELVAAGVAT